MGLLDSLGWDSLEKSKSSVSDWLSAVAVSGLQATKSAVRSILTTSRRFVVETLQDVKEETKKAASPLFSPLGQAWDSAAEARNQFLKDWAFAYRFNMLILPLGVIALTGKGVRPRLLRVIAVGAPASALLTPELNPFNRR